ncbi:unnamed protein product [Urochloa decumbens]|uniref:Uncharacterized protein n=1 Tax=Urochloa decumbens TaxID=240449 RepID=A0ABC9FQF1_9POAL
MDVVLGKLPSKLLELLKDEYKLQTGVKDQISSCSRELENMCAVLRKVAQVPPDELDELVRLWARDVREASYDMEDILDNFLVRIDGGPVNNGPADDDAAKVKRLIKKMGNLFSLSKAKARHEIAGAIEELSKRLEDISKLHGRYTADDIVPKQHASTNGIDPLLEALYKKESQLVGIDKPRDKLISMLSTVDDNKEIKMVSVVGFGGLGKTTLARVVFKKLTADDRSYYKAFVPVGRNPDLKKALRDVLIGLDKERYTMKVNLTVLDQMQLIDEVQEYLKDKRYFIVIDDIWDVLSLETIKWALEDNGLGCKVIITTRNHDVAENVKYSYQMEPLPKESSEKLFYGKIFGSKDQCPGQLVEVSEKILKKCGGVPLALTTISSLLANKSRNRKEWYDVCHSIGSGLGSSNDIKNMRKILSLSYYDLPSHLKTCLLYLSMFPDDFVIWKSRLIWRWIAEDFVQPEGADRSFFEIGESYFNELVNRSLIQPEYMDNQGIAWACRVHDMVLDLICSLSREEGFVTILKTGTVQSTPSSGSKVHRLSLHNNTRHEIDMSKLRSLTLFSCSILKSMPRCLHLRVLDLIDCNLADHTSLWFVGDLFHLRYLSLRDTKYAGKLPVEIGNLQFLQTLDIIGNRIKELPSSIKALRQLMFLYIQEDTRLPRNGLRRLTSLEMLRAGVDSQYVAEELGHLTQLRSVEVVLGRGAEEGRWDSSMSATFVRCLGKLHKLQRLWLGMKGTAVDLEGAVDSLGNLALDDDHLPSLQSVEVYICGEHNVSKEVVWKVEGVLKQLANAHHNRPRVRLG